MSTSSTSNPSSPTQSTSTSSASNPSTPTRYTSTSSNSNAASPTPDFRNWRGGFGIVLQLEEHILLACSCELTKKLLVEDEHGKRFKIERKEGHFFHKVDETSVCLFMGLEKLAEAWRKDFFARIAEEREAYATREVKKQLEPVEKTFTVDEYVALLRVFQRETFSGEPKEAVDVVLASWNPCSIHTGTSASVIYFTNGAATVVDESRFRAGSAFAVPIEKLESFDPGMGVWPAVNFAEECIFKHFGGENGFGVDVWFFGPGCAKDNKKRKGGGADNITRKFNSMKNLKEKFAKSRSRKR